MATIREELVLKDLFSSTFSNYIKMAQQSNANTKQLNATLNETTKIARLQTATNNTAAASLRRQTAEQNLAAAAARRQTAEQNTAAATARKLTAEHNAAAAAARRQTAELKLLNTQTQATSTQTIGLTTSIRGLVGAFAGLSAVKGLVTLSDDVSAITARLDMMNDGLQTTAELNEMVYQSAMRARGSYIEMGNFIAKLGTLASEAFDNNQELVLFAEQVNKQMALSRTTTGEAQAAMLQLSQALSSGRLQGDELRSIMEQVPMLAQTIAKHLGVSVGEMRNLASEGKITATVVKNAVLGAAQETNAAFEDLPMTWGQVWTMAKNIAIKALNPVLKLISALANNIEIVAPLVIGLGSAFLVFKIAANWTRIATAATAAYHFVVNLLSVAFGVLRGSTAAASAATMMFNSALLASPITWIVLGVMLLVAALYAVVAAINKAKDTSISATGIIFGAFYALGAAILNTFVIPVQNKIAALVNFIGNVFNDPIAAIKMLFYDLAISAIGHIQNIAQAIEDLINKIPGLEVNITSGIDNLYNKVKTARENVKNASEWKEYVKAWDYIDMGNAFKAGYAKGEGLGNTISNWGSNLFDGYSIEDIATDTGDIADSAKAIESAVNMAAEDIKALVDIAERRYVNKINLTAQTPVINIQGQNTGNTAADRQNLADTIRDVLVEQLSAGSLQSTARAY